MYRNSRNWKISVIKELEKLGHIVIHEAVTDVISQEQAKADMRPWERRDFIDKITQVQKDRQMNLKVASELSEAIQKNSRSHEIKPRGDVEF